MRCDVKFAAHRHKIRERGKGALVESRLDRHYAAEMKQTSLNTARAWRAALRGSAPHRTAPHRTATQKNTQNNAIKVMQVK